MPELDLTSVPPLETLCPTAIGAEIRLIPTTLTEIRLRMLPGYSRATGGQCWSAQAYHVRDGQESLPASIASSDDCIPVPEAPPLMGLEVALVLLAAVSRRRVRAR